MSIISFLLTTAIMKFLTLASVLPLVSGHAIFQRVSINGVDQGLLNGVRSPNSNYPLQNVQAAEIACNKDFRSPVSSTVLKVPAGAKVGAYWQHLIGGPQGSNDPDNPIAASHKGPITVYLAKVSNAASSGTSGLAWFKIAQGKLTINPTQWDHANKNRGFQHWYPQVGCRHHAFW